MLSRPACFSVCTSLLSAECATDKQPVSNRGGAVMSHHSDVSGKPGADGLRLA